MSEEKLMEGFFRFDLDNSGSICCTEIKHVLEQYQGMDKESAKKTALKIMKMCDKDGDGEISWEEFKNAMSQCS